MKKFIVICLSLVMLFSLSVTALAANGAFIKSPSRNTAPIIIEFKSNSNEDGKCDTKLIVTPYNERNTLPEDLLARIEKAYSDIAGTNDITTFNNDIKKLAEDKGIKGTDLAVSDLFDLRVVDCTVHEDHTSYTIELDSENLDRFVALIHANEKGEWEIVADAKVTENGKRLKFSVESFSPFAIVVNRNETVEPGDNTMIIIWVMVAAASGLLLVALLAKKNKKQHEL